MQGGDGPSVSLSVTLQGVNDNIKQFLESALERLAAEAQGRLQQQQQQQQQQPRAVAEQEVLWSGSLRIEGGLTVDKLRRFVRKRVPERTCSETEDVLATNLVGLPVPSTPQLQRTLPQELTDEQFNVQFEKENQTPVFDRISHEVLQKSHDAPPAAAAGAGTATPASSLLSLLPGVEAMPMGLVEHKGSKGTKGQRIGHRRLRLSQSRCFNCGSYAHPISACQKPRDPAAIQASRDRFNEAKAERAAREGMNANGPAPTFTSPGGQVSSGRGSSHPTRYFNNPQVCPADLAPAAMSPGFAPTPGVISARLASALGMLHPSDPPPWLSNMAAHGLPPGYSLHHLQAVQQTEKEAHKEQIDEGAYDEIQIIVDDQELSAPSPAPLVSCPQAEQAAAPQQQTTVPPPSAAVQPSRSAGEKELEDGGLPPSAVQPLHSAGENDPDRTTAPQTEPPPSATVQPSRSSGEVDLDDLEDGELPADGEDMQLESQEERDASGHTPQSTHASGNTPQGTHSAGHMQGTHSHIRQQSLQIYQDSASCSAQFPGLNAPPPPGANISLWQDAIAAATAAAAAAAAAAATKPAAPTQNQQHSNHQHEVLFPPSTSSGPSNQYPSFPFVFGSSQNAQTDNGPQSFSSQPPVQGNGVEAAGAGGVQGSMQFAEAMVQLEAAAAEAAAAEEMFGMSMMWDAWSQQALQQAQPSAARTPHQGNGNSTEQQQQQQQDFSAIMQMAQLNPALTEQFLGGAYGWL